MLYYNTILFYSELTLLLHSLTHDDIQFHRKKEKNNGRLCGNGWQAYPIHNQESLQRGICILDSAGVANIWPAQMTNCAMFWNTHPPTMICMLWKKLQFGLRQCALIRNVVRNDRRPLLWMTNNDYYIIQRRAMLCQ